MLIFLMFEVENKYSLKHIIHISNSYCSYNSHRLKYILDTL